MNLSERSHRAIEACYDAAIASERWPAALQLLGESLGAQSCTFFTGDPVTDPIRMPRSEGHEDFAQLWLSNEAHAPDPHARRLRTRFNPARPYSLEEDVSTEEERRTLAYYREIAAPGNRDWWADACFQVEARCWCLPLYRGAARGPFTASEAVYASALARHLSKAIGFAEKCAGIALASGLGTLEQLRVAALVLDSRGLATDLNVSAQRLMGADFGLRRGRPVSGDPASNRRLQKFMAAALDTRSQQRVTNGPIVIDRAGAPWLLVDALPVTRFGSDLFSAGRLILTLTDLTARSMPDATVLMIAFGLTRAEARLAAEIAFGHGIDDAAATCGIRRETVRTQLKAVFAKTNTARQAELASLVARLRP